MLVKLSSSALKQTRWHEYGVRFLLGELATVVAAIVSARFGVAVGGLFLALPAILCANATLIESHERLAKEKPVSAGGDADNKPQRWMLRAQASEASASQRSPLSSTSWYRQALAARSPPPSWPGPWFRCRRGV